eukprot:5222778-Prymnesium_polylepis.1
MARVFASLAFSRRAIVLGLAAALLVRVLLLDGRVPFAAARVATGALEVPALVFALLALEP